MSLKAALYYHKLGFSIIPVGRNKRPLVRWEKYQTEMADKQKIYEWFDKNPSPNIGIITGKVSGLTVIDADSDDAFNFLNEYLPESFLTPTVKTPKGKHVYFAYDPAFSNAVRLISEIDVRNNGGYVVAPPSKNGYGKKYAWLENLGIQNIKPQLMPDMLRDILLQSSTLLGNKIDSYSSSMRQNDSNTEVTRSNISNMFTKGRRDNDIFRVANCLIKGGMPEEEARNYLRSIALMCDPPFSEKDADLKVASALKRDSDRDKVTTQQIRDFIEVTSGNFSVTNLYHSVTLVTSKQKMKARVILGRLVNEGLIEKVGKRDGIYRKVEDTSKKIDLNKIEEKEFPLQLPFDMHDLIIPQPKNIIVVAGERDSGKSCFCLNAAKMNLNRGFGVKYLTSEMGGAELKSRLLKFEPDVPYEHWLNCDFKECSSNFQDSIDPDGLTIIDYLKLEDSFYLIGGEIKRIFDKLRNGIAIIAIQKKHKERLGVGGQFTLDEARLYVTLSSNPPSGGIARIEKAKNWRREDFNPNSRECDFKIYRGAIMTKIGEWVKT